MLAEFIATFMFVFLGVGAIGAIGLISGVNGIQLVLVGLAHGLAIMVGVITVARISGAHMNPAITMATLITGNIGLVRASMYVVAQVGGAILAALALNGLAFAQADLGVHTISRTIGTSNGFVLEVILTFFLAFAMFATVIDKRGNKALAPLAIGTVIALGHFVAMPLTGASMNPARSLGPALVNGAWADHWVYWVAPILGAVVAGITYAVVFGDDAARRRAGAIALTEADRTD